MFLFFLFFYFGVYFGDQRGFCILYGAQEIAILDLVSSRVPD